MLGSEVALLQLTGLPLSTVLEAEAHLGAALGGEAGAVSALRVLQLYLERLGCTLPVRAGPGLAGWRRRGLGTRGPGAPPPPWCTGFVPGALACRVAGQPRGTCGQAGGEDAAGGSRQGTGVVFGRPQRTAPGAWRPDAHPHPRQRPTRLPANPPVAQALEKCQLLEVMALSAVDLVRKAALSPALAAFRPSVVAAACLLSARERLGLAPAWPRALQSMTAYTPAAEGALKQCLAVMQLLGIGRAA